MLNQSYFRLTKTLGIKIEELLSDIPQLKELTPTMYDKLAANGFIIDQNIDELNIVRERYESAVHSKDYFLVILPTLNCNYSCWYCIQDHIPSIMSQATQESIKRHIDYMIDVKEINSLHIEWFGGEPFMFFKQVIEPISQYAISRCEEKGIPFINSATTNGYFLTPKVSQQLQSLKFSHFQITLDGEKEFHDKVKFQIGCDSTFDRVLTNINNILNNNDNLRVFLRINYTHKTLTSKIVDQINPIINETNRPRIIITPKKVWQENVDKSFHSTIINILNKFSSAGYKVQRWSPPYASLSCYTNKEYYNAINYNGNVVKCTACNDLYEKEGKGQLLSDGTIAWKENFNLLYQCKSHENERCLKCKYLPICMGVCPRDHLLGREHCTNDVIDNSFEKSIIDFVKHEYDN